MGRVASLETRQNLVSNIESMIHHPAELHSVVAEAKRSLSQTGHLPGDTLWDYLVWRRDIDPSRFDHYHPEFVSVFTQQQYLLEHELGKPTNNSADNPIAVSSISVPDSPISTSDARSIVPTIGSNGGPLGGSPDVRPFNGSVPEPSSVSLLAVALIVGGLWYRYMRPDPIEPKLLPHITH